MKAYAYRPARIIAMIAAAAIIAVGGTAYAETRNDVRSPDRERIAEAAVKAAGGGTATDIERSDDPGAAYEVEVQRANGVEAEVNLDKNLRVVRAAVEDDDDDNDQGDDI